MPADNGEGFKTPSEGTHQHENNTQHLNWNQRGYRAAEHSPNTTMNDPQIHRESSDTFGNNTKADMELLRRIYERSHYQSDEIFALAAICAAVFSLIAVAVCIVRAFL